MKLPDESFVYVLVRGDGWHKVGCSWRPENRCGALSLKVAPIKLVQKFPVFDMYGVEWLAHYALRARARRGEWFDASADECCAAVKRAIGHHKKLGRAGLSALRAREIERKRRDPKTGMRLPATGSKPGRKTKEWPSAEVKADWQRRWKSKNYASDAAVVREAKEAGYTERMVRRFGKSGRTR